MVKEYDDPADRRKSRSQQIGKRSGGAVVLHRASAIARPSRLTHSLKVALSGPGRLEASFFNTGVRHHGRHILLQPSQHDGDKRRSIPLRHAWFRQIGQPRFLFGLISTNCCVAAHGLNHLRQTVQRFASKNNIDHSGALANVLVSVHVAAYDTTNWILSLAVCTNWKTFS